MKRLLFVALAMVVVCALMQPSPLQAQGKDKAKPKAQEATGMVKSVSGTSLVVNSAGKDMTFTVDSETKFVGKGLSTKAAKQGKMTAPDAVGANDRVSVTYHDMAGTLHASNVKILNKAPGKK